MSILVTLAVLIANAAPSPAVGPDVIAANAWVKLVDDKRWGESWNSAGILFKSQMPEARWTSTIEPVRDPLGEVASRSLTSVARSNALPGAPDGDYEVVRFQTSFAHKAMAVETIVLAREASGWKVDGYFIR